MAIILGPRTVMAIKQLQMTTMLYRENDMYLTTVLYLFRGTVCPSHTVYQNP